MGIDALPGRSFASVFHGFQTMPGMVGVLVASVAAALVAMIAVAVSVPRLGVVVAAGLAFVLCVGLLGLWSQSSFFRFASRVEVRFPPPKER